MKKPCADFPHGVLSTLIMREDVEVYKIGSSKVKYPLVNSVISDHKQKYVFALHLLSNLIKLCCYKIFTNHTMLEVIIYALTPDSTTPENASNNYVFFI